MSAYNPNSPDTLGCEFLPTIKASDILQSPSHAAAWQWDQVGDDSIDLLYVFIPAATAPNLSDGDGYMVEVYDASNLGALTTSVISFNPSDTAVNVANQTYAFGPFAPDGEQVDIWRGIDSYPDPLFSGKGALPNSGGACDNTEGIYPIFGSGFQASFRFAGIVGALTGKRIIRVSVCAYVQSYVAYKQPPAMGITPFISVGDNVVYGAHKSVQGTVSGGHLIQHDWYASPSSHCAWSPGEIEFLDDSSTAWSAGWLVDPTPNSNVTAMILQGWLEVEYADDFTNPVLGHGCLAYPTPGWNWVAMSGGLSGFFDREDGITYIAMIRHWSGGGRAAMRYLDSGEAPTPTPAQARDVTFAARTRIPMEVGDELSKCWAIAWKPDSSSSVAADSTPYASSGGDFESVLNIDEDPTQVFTGRDLKQKITTVGAKTYGWCRVMVKLDESAATEDLVIKLTNGAGTQQGASLTISPDDLVTPRTGWQIVEGRVGGTALLAATQYRLVFSSATTSDKPWHVQVLSCLEIGPGTDPADPPNSPAGIGDATFGGVTDLAVIDGVDDDTMDVAATIATQPATPSGLTISLGAPVTCVDTVVLVWSTQVISDGGGFLQWEVERSDAYATGWQRVANITDDAVVSFTDREARAERQQFYRLRVRRVDMSASQWTGVTSIVPTTSCCGFSLTTNLDADLAVWGDDVGPQRRFDWSRQPVSHERLIGRPYRVALRSLDKDGDRFEVDLVLAMKDGITGVEETTTPGRRTFDDLLALTPEYGASLPYVCVRNSNGDRWFADVVVKNGTEVEPAGRYTATIEVVELTNTPYPIDSES